MKLFGNKKVFLFFLLIFITLLFLFTIISQSNFAVAGCCLNPDSDYLCQDVSVSDCCSNDYSCQQTYSESNCDSLPECEPVCCCHYDENGVESSAVVLNISCDGNKFALSGKSCSDICNDNKPVPVSDDCNLSTNPLSKINVDFDLSGYPRKILLNWEDPCFGEVLYYNVSRIDLESRTQEHLDNVMQTSYTDTTFNFLTKYQYNITAVYSTNKVYTILSDTINTGNIECWMAPPGAFCIDFPYYLKYTGYFGYDNQEAFSNFLQQEGYAENYNAAYRCEGRDLKLIQDCGRSGKFCVIGSSGEPICSEAKDCSTYNYDLGLNPDKEDCENNAGCYFDSGEGLGGLCLSCDASYLDRTCYSYRSKEACEKDLCSFAVSTGGCEWVSLNDELGLGVCIDKSNINCKDCNLYLKDLPYQTCEDLYKEDSRFSGCAICGIIDSCTQYNNSNLCIGGQEAQIDLTTHKIIPSADFCGLGVCDYFETDSTCAKNIDLDPDERDCNKGGSNEREQCEKDIFVPQVKLKLDFDKDDFELGKNITFIVSDRRESETVNFFSSGEVLSDGYALYLCVGSDCFTKDHLSWKSFDKTSVSSCDLISAGLNVHTSNPQTLYYFVKDPSGNVAEVQSLNIVINATRVCKPGDTRPCPKQQGVCNGAIQHCNLVCPAENIGFYSRDCSFEEYSDNTNGPYEAFETTVDGLDNDCDGLIDEGAKKEVLCNGIDDNGDGRVDEGYPDFDGDNNPEICDYNSFDVSKDSEGHIIHHPKIKQGINLTKYGYIYNAKYCGADCVDLDADNDAIVDSTSTGEPIDKENTTKVGCIVLTSGPFKGVAKDSDQDGICDGLDNCVNVNPDCAVEGYNSPNKDLIGCPVDCKSESCLGEPYCQEQCNCDSCADFYGMSSCDYAHCTLGCGCYFQTATTTCMDCSFVTSCEKYNDAQSCRSNSCHLLSKCEWSDSIGCYTDNDNDGIPDDKDPCPFDSQNDADGDGFCWKESNSNLVGKTVDVNGRTFVLKGGFDCDDNNDEIYPRTDFVEGNESLCDFKDNDCDGLIDEGCSCVKGDFRSCGNPFLDYSEFSKCNRGIQYCIDGVWSDNCSGFKGPEIDNEAEQNFKSTKYCDGFDNDCNGLIDDKCPCLPDETIPCGTDLGVCSFGYRKCGDDLRFEDKCVYTNDSQKPQKEICGNYLDDDCDGSIDEGCPCVEGQTMSCPDSTSLVFSNSQNAYTSVFNSACRQGVQKCISGVWTTCDGFVGPQVMVEDPSTNPQLCDSKDNNCDGLIDEGCSCYSNQSCATNCGWGTQECEAGIYSDECIGARVPSAEKLDNVDNDCDGLIDEGFPEKYCDGRDDDGDGWVDDGCPDFDGDNDPRICDFSNPLQDKEGKIHFKTQDKKYYCGADAIDLDKDNDGVLDDSDRDPSTPLGCEVNRDNGIAIDTDGDGICDGLDKCQESLPGCPVYGYDSSDKDVIGCPKDCANSKCITSSYCKCPSCDVCEESFLMPQGCQPLQCSYCAMGQCAISEVGESEQCTSCTNIKSCEGYITEEDCNRNPCLTNVSCVWNGTNCLLDTDGDGLADNIDPCPQDKLNDNDGDGYCAHQANDDFVKRGELFGGNDCNDNDASIHIGCGCIVDKDNDGYGQGCLWGQDCDDTDPEKNTHCDNGCIEDMDGDGFGRGCSAGPDCDDSNATITNQCDPSVFCSNGYLDNDESDIDCGGICEPCDAGKKCKTDSDCKSNICNRGLCYDEELCNNGIKDDFESDVDCGGPCNLCQKGQSCISDLDCKSNNCVNGVCSIPTCDDNKRNQDETDVDCGGHICKPCDIGKHCKANSDCISSKCDQDTQKCVPSKETSVTKKDSDGDGMPDYWELKYGLNPNDGSDADLDLDKDGLFNYKEYILNLDPTNPDTDGDGIKDGKEVDKGLDPRVPDKRGPLGLIISLIILLTGGGLGYVYRDKLWFWLNKYGITDFVYKALKKSGILDFVYLKLLKKTPPTLEAIKKVKTPKTTQNININEKQKVIKSKPAQVKPAPIQPKKPKVSEKLEKKIKEKSKIFDAFETEDTEKNKKDEDLFKEFEK